MSENALDLYQQQSGFLAPVISVKAALAAYQAKKELIDGILRENVDYGIIPGTQKPTLLKAGAEKAVSFFGLHPVFRDAAVVEDWTGENHGGEPFFYYRRTCELWRGDQLIAAADGSCNSWEKKYRYRSADRVCPACGKPTIIKGQEKYGGGWICFQKKGGCGAKYADKDSAILSQVMGQVANPDVADAVNTILKMADKRALVASTLIATGMSEYYTQDVEDYVVGEYTDAPQHTERQSAPPQQPAQKPMSNGIARPWSPAHLKEMIDKSAAAYEKKGEVIDQVHRNLLAPNIEKCFLGDAEAKDKRNLVLTYLSGVEHLADIPDAVAIAIRGWLAVKKDDHGEWIPDVVAAQEAQMIISEIYETVSLTYDAKETHE